MPFVSVTRLRIRAVQYLPAFFVHTWRSQRQLRAANGFLAGQLATGRSRTFWTITLWKSEGTMRMYRNSGPHMRAMPKLLHWCDEASMAHWEQREAALPSMAEAARQLETIGRISKVHMPSEAHAARSTWPDRIVPSAGLMILPDRRS